MVHNNEPTKPCAWYSIVFPGLHAPKIPKIHIWLVTKVIPQKHRCHQIDSDRFSPAKKGGRDMMFLHKIRKISAVLAGSQEKSSPIPRR